MHEHDIGMCSLHMQIAQVFCRCEERMRTAQEEWEGKGGNKGGGREGNERRDGTKGEREIEDLGQQLASFSLTQSLLRLGCCVFRPLFGQIKLLLNPFQSGRVPLKEDGERGRGRKRVRGKG